MEATDSVYVIHGEKQKRLKKQNKPRNQSETPVTLKSMKT
jgi:hypothetical protein